MRFLLFVTGAFLFAALGGCLENTTPPIAPGTGVDDLVNSLEGYVDPFIRNHDHAVAANHQLAFHVKQLAHDPLGGNMLKSSGAHVVDVQNGWLFVGAYGLAADVDGGLYVFSLADPKEPKLTGRFPLPGNVGGDRSVEATDDANWVVLGTESIDCANHANPFLPGLFLIDVRDKANPKLADYKPDSSGVHSVIIHRIGGQDYAYTLGGADTSNGQNIWQIDTMAGKLNPVGSVPIAHDGAAYDDPLLGKPLLYVADVTDLKVYDLSDPAHPKKIGSWQPPDNKNHYVHAVTMDLIEGHRILALESEDWGQMTSPLWILDATNLDAMELLSTYENPAQAPANAGQNEPSLAFSTHNPRLEDGIVYMAHYHAGIWMLDVRTLDKARAPEIMGYFLPHDDNGGYKPASSQSALPLPANPICFGGFRIHELPNTMDVEVQDGIAYGADLHTGLYTVQWDPTVVPGAGHQH
jgi:hypothetical protein